MTKAEYDSAVNEIMDLTGGSSQGGRMSLLWGFFGSDAWGFLYGNAPFPRPSLESEYKNRIAPEAAVFQHNYGADLSKQANALLKRICEKMAAEPQGKS